MMAYGKITVIVIGNSIVTVRAELNGILKI